MHIGKSTRKAMFEQELKAAEVAERMGYGIDRVYQLRRTRISASATSIEKLAEAFGMKVSEFIALGED